MTETAERKKPPVQRFGPVSTGSGRVEVAVWENQGANDKPFYTATVQRSYTTPDSKWHRTQVLMKDDLLTVAQLLTQAWQWICQEHDAREE